jgi:uncharacterized protein (TIGR04255 family)
MNAATQSAVTLSHSEYPNLRNAPITEAIVDWRAKLPPDVTPETLKTISDQVAPEYTLAGVHRGFQYQIRATAEQASQQSGQDLGVQGYQFRTVDQRQVATVKQDGFSFSRLRPYTRWEDVFREADRLWRVYREVARPEEVTRIAVRYLNRIPLPMPVGDFTRYLTKPPDLPDGVPPHLTSLFYRVVVRDLETGISANITQLVEGQLDQGGKAPFILDIDAYIRKTIDPNSADFYTLFAPLREMKNRIFFATLTPTAIEMFK